MQFNNWNLALQMCLLYDDALSESHLLVFSGEPPAMDPTLPAGVAHLMVAARASDWLGTYALGARLRTSLGGEGAVGGVTRIGDAQRYGPARIRWASYDAPDDSLLIQLVAQGRLAVGPADEEAALPTWYAVMQLGSPTEFPTVSDSSAPFLMGPIASEATDPATDPAPLVRLTASGRKGGAPLSSAILPLVLPT